MEPFDNTPLFEPESDSEHIPQQLPDIPAELLDAPAEADACAHLTSPESVEEPAAEPAAPQPPRSEPYAYSKPKTSPYASSPYEMPHRQSQPSPAPKAPKAVKPPKKKGRGKKILALILSLALVGGAVFGAAMWAAEQNRWSAQLQSQIDDLTQRIQELESAPAMGTLPGGTVLPTDGSSMTPAQLYATQVHSVVAISTTVQTSSFYGSSTGTSAGSGFILTQDGYVITNYHVVESATAIEVLTYDGESYDAVLVGFDSSNDLAVLKIEAEGLAAASLGSSTDLAIGDMVVAIGNPLGELSATQTVGYVSGIDREVSTDNLTTIQMIQTDAAINPGNSGGPLFNMYGQVIGITTAKYSGTTGSGASIEGIGFAIPIDDVEPLIDDLIDYGYVTGAYMGVSVKNTDEDSAAMFGLPTGAYIVSIEEGGAADRAGLQEKDIVIALGEHTVTNVTTLTRALRNFQAGDTVDITFIRSGREMTLPITLDEKPQQTTEQPSGTPQQNPNTLPEDYEDLYDYFRRFFG